MNKERTEEMGELLRKTHNGVIEKAPKILRPASVGFAIGAGLEHNFLVFGLSLAVGAGSALILESRRRAVKRHQEKSV